MQSNLGDGIGTDYSSTFVGHVIMEQGDPMTIKGFVDKDLFLVAYYAYLPTYIDCVVTRTLSSGYQSKVHICISIHWYRFYYIVC